MERQQLLDQGDTKRRRIEPPTTETASIKDDHDDAADAEAAPSEPRQEDTETLEARATEEHRVQTMLHQLQTARAAGGGAGGGAGTNTIGAPTDSDHNMLVSHLLRQGHLGQQHQHGSQDHRLRSLMDPQSSAVEQLLALQQNPYGQGGAPGGAVAAADRYRQEAMFRQNAGLGNGGPSSFGGMDPRLGNPQQYGMDLQLSNLFGGGYGAPYLGGGSGSMGQQNGNFGMLELLARQQQQQAGFGMAQVPSSAGHGLSEPAASASRMAAARSEREAAAASAPAATRTELGPIALAAAASTGKQVVRLLFMPCDDADLSEYQCLVRKQIEAFEASDEDMDTNARGRNRAIVRGQVGIRCRHCKIVPPQHRQRAALYYPSKLERLYQMSQTIASVHLLEHCDHMPKEVRAELVRLRQVKSAALGGKKYWADAGKAMGLAEEDKRLFYSQA